MVPSGAGHVFILEHGNRLLLFVKHLAMRILTRRYRTRQQYTDW
jgi:hypothetical protein